MKEKAKMPFDERVYSIVWNYYVNGRYGKDEIKAIKTLHKYHPEYDRDYCSKVFKEYCKVLKDAIDFVELHKESYWEHYKNKSYLDLSVPDEKERAFYRLHDTVDEQIMISMITLIFNWYHVR
jgi:hypothetical protein